MTTKIRINEKSPFAQIPVPDLSRAPFDGYWVRIDEDKSNGVIKFGIVAISVANTEAKTWLSRLRPSKELALADWEKGFEVSLTGNDHTADVVKVLLKQGAAVKVSGS